MLVGHIAHRVAVEDLAVRGSERGRMADGQLLLAMAQLWIILIHFDALRFQCSDDSIHHLRGCCHANGGEAQAFIERFIGSIGSACSECEFTLEGRAHSKTCSGACGNLPLEERAWASLPRGAVLMAHVHRHGRGMRGIWKNSESLRVGNKADFANRSHSLDRGKLVEHIHRLHRYSQADAIVDATAQAFDVCRFAARDAAVISIKESYQAHSGFAGRLGYAVSGGGCVSSSFDRHRRSLFVSFIARFTKIQNIRSAPTHAQYY